jgi:hypothetical protein
MSKATYPLEFLSIKKAAQQLAKEDGVSLTTRICVPKGRFTTFSLTAQDGHW